MAHVEASQVVPSLDSFPMQRTHMKRQQGTSQKVANLKIHLRRMTIGCQRFLRN